MCIRHSHQTGVTLIELIVAMVIISVGLAGVLTSLNLSARHSADPIQPKQALAIAEALLEEILLKDYCDPSFPTPITPAITGNIISGSTSLSGISPATTITAGWQVSGTGIRGSALVAASPAPTATTLTLSSAALTAGTAVPLTVAACEASAGENRTTYDNVSDYHNPTKIVATTLDGSAITGYQVAINVTTVADTDTLLPRARQVTVTVSTPSAGDFSLTGYRMPY